MPLSELYLHPIKSAAALAMSRMAITAQGPLHDREWLVVSADDHRFVTGRELPYLTQIRADLIPGGLIAHAPNAAPIAVLETRYTTRIDTQVWRDSFPAYHGDAQVDAWLSHVLGIAVKLLYLGRTASRLQKSQTDPLSFADGYPYMLIGHASLLDLNQQLAHPVSMRHFRPNIVVSGTLPYEEDEWKVIRIGDIVFDIVHPCTRCVFTTIDPCTGIPDVGREPLLTLARTRRTKVGICFGQNMVARNTGFLQLGDPVEVLESTLLF